MNETATPVRCALISVADKTGILPVATALVARGVTLISTGGSAQALAAAGLPVTEVATVTGFATEGGRKILEAGTVGDLQVEWRRAARAVPPGTQRVRTDQPLGAIAVYLCEPESDDGAIENGVISAPAAGGEFPIWRALA